MLNFNLIAEVFLKSECKGTAFFFTGKTFLLFFSIFTLFLRSFDFRQENWGILGCFFDYYCLLSFFPSCFLLPAFFFLFFFFDLVEEHQGGDRRRRGTADGAYLPAKPQLYINVRANEIGLSVPVLEQEKNASFFSCFFVSSFFLCIFAYDYGSIATSLPRKLPIIINDRTIRTEKKETIHIHIDI